MKEARSLLLLVLVRLIKVSLLQTVAMAKLVLLLGTTTTTATTPHKRIRMKHGQLFPSFFHTDTGKLTRNCTLGKYPG